MNKTEKQAFDWSEIGSSISDWMKKNPWAMYGGAGGALLGGASGLFNRNAGVGGLLTRALLGGLLGTGLGAGSQYLSRNWGDLWGKNQEV